MLIEFAILSKYHPPAVGSKQPEDHGFGVCASIRVKGVHSTSNVATPSWPGLADHDGLVLYRRDYSIIGVFLWCQIHPFEICRCFGKHPACVDLGRDLLGVTPASQQVAHVRDGVLRARLCLDVILISLPIQTSFRQAPFRIFFMSVPSTLGGVPVQDWSASRSKPTCVYLSYHLYPHEPDFSRDLAASRMSMASYLTLITSIM